MKTGNKVWKAPMGIFVIFLVFIFVLFIQYLYLSISPNVYGINMQDFASQRNTYSGTLYAKRGTIYDSDNNILATDVASYTVIAYLDESRTGSSTTLYHVVDKEKTAEALSPIIHMSVDAILNLLNQEVYQVELGPGGRGITEITKNKIEQLNLPGIDFIESHKRYYPNGDFASYIIGYTKKKDITVEIDDVTKTENVLVGELGIEVKYDEILRGTNGYTRYQQDRYGVKIPDTKEESFPAIDGSDIYLSIDSNIQRILENAIDESEKYNPEWMTISVMDAKTGDILASASSPSYDPNILNITNYENPLTSFVYEPGSVMKIFTYMCAIEKGTYRGNETYPSGSFKFDEATVYDWNNVGWGEITFDYGFEMSSNIAVSYIMERFLTKEDLKNCFNAYGFNDITGIELPRELTGNMKFNYPIEVASAAFGQGISTTPIQHLQALSIVANDGYMLKPHIVTKIESNGEVTYERKIEKIQVVSKETTDKIKQLMYDTVHDVERHATGIWYKVDGLDVIGKTGTAELFDNEAGAYLKQYIYSFSGMFPKDDPEIIVFVSMKKPTTSTAIRKITKNVLESIGNYKGLIGNNTSSDSPVKYTLPSFVNQNTKEVIEKLENDGLKVTILGKGDRVVNQYPYADSVILSNDEVVLITNDSNIKMPSLLGYSRIKAISILNLLNIEYEIEGYGFVENQSIAEGSAIKDKVLITLKEKYILEE